MLQYNVENQYHVCIQITKDIRGIETNEKCNTLTKFYLTKIVMTIIILTKFQ